jgi:hypothetical protein
VWLVALLITLRLAFDHHGAFGILTTSNTYRGLVIFVSAMPDTWQNQDGEDIHVSMANQLMTNLFNSDQSTL